MDSSLPQIGRTVLICHQDEPLNRYGLASWLAGFTDLAGVIVIREKNSRFRRRVQREIKRVGLPRSLDVFLFQIYYRLFHADADEKWESSLQEKLLAQYGEPNNLRLLETADPNSLETETFLHDVQPDIILARCKSILKKKIYSKARLGTFVMHPGICPAYRNAHGCFWALANRDLANVGMTLLKIDDGVDTGPVYGYYTYEFDEVAESHVVIQNRVVFDNLPALQAKFGEILAGLAVTVDTRGSKSQTWGQPWLTRYLSWKIAARETRKRMYTAQDEQ